MTEPDADPTPRGPSRGRKAPASRGRFFQFCAWSFSGLVTIALIGAVGMMALLGTRISAPDWLRDRVTTELNAGLEGVRLEVGDLSLFVQEGLAPRVGLRDVVVYGPGGDRLARLGEVQGDVPLRPILQGVVRPAEIRVSGVQLDVRRAANGRIGLSVDGGPVTEASGGAAEFSGLRMGLHDVVEAAHAVLDQPELRGLTRVAADNITLRYEDERAGHAWTADGARVLITRDGDDLRLRGDAALLGGHALVTTIEVNYEGRIGEVASQLGVTFQDMPARDIAGQSPALSWLGALEAPISGALRVSVDDAGALGPLHATLQIGAGALHPEDGARPIEFDAARSYFTFEPQEQKIVFSEVWVASRWVTARAEGHAWLVGAEEGWPSKLWVQFDLSDIVANPEGLYPRPIVLETARVDMQLDLDPFAVRLGELSLRDQGEVLHVIGDIQAARTGWTVALDATLERIAPDRLLVLWPEALARNARKWVVGNVQEAGLSNIRFALRAQPDAAPDVFLGFDFAGFATRFIRDVPLIKAARGTATLHDDRFVVFAESGHITADEGGRIDISGTAFEIPKVDVPRTPARVHLNAAAPITAALSLLDAGPFGFLTRADLPVTLADGRAAVSGLLDFRMVDKLDVRDVQFDVSGQLHNVESDTLVPGRVISAQEIDLLARHTGLELQGEARVGDVPVSAHYEMPFGPPADVDSPIGRVRGDIELSERFTREFDIALPPGSLSGSGTAALEIDLAREGPAAFRLQSDLEGVALQIDALNWALPAPQTGRLDVAGALGAQPVIDVLDLEAPGLTARGAVSLRDTGALDRATFTQVRAGQWLDAPVELVGRGAGAAPEVRLLGGQIDLRRTSLLGGARSGRGESGPLTLALDRLQITDGIALTGFRASLDMRQGPSGTFTGNLNGATPISGQVIPQNGRSAFRIRSQDAGGVFASAGILKQARNGDLDISLVPGKGNGVWEGQLKAQGNIRLKDAPAMAALLNALSVVGLLEQMGGEGIHFEQVDARFQIAPDRLTLYSGSAIGASMGISMDGYYYPVSKRMDMQGVVSPLYLVNAVGGIFTRRGEGLIGFSYTIRGAASAPVVGVNPLSAFTPGMFRELFRRRPPAGAVPSASGGGTGTQAQTQTGTGSAAASGTARPVGSGTRQSGRDTAGR
ncbi:MAG: AsmA-like C-terminal region-containing protein [Pseudomonadota bacterium]